MTATDMLLEHGIELRRPLHGTVRAACPQCDRGPRDDALAVTEDERGIVWCCHRCGWRGAVNGRRGIRFPKSTEFTRRDMGVYARELWLAASFDDAYVEAHPYCVRKGIVGAGGARRGKATGRVIGRDADCIIVPIRADAVGKLQAVQCINAEGKKQTFGPVNGGALALGNTMNKRIEWYVAEGWASAYSVVFHHRRGHAVCAVAFGKSNMTATAQILARQFKPAEIVVLQERDA